MECIIPYMESFDFDSWLRKSELTKSAISKLSGVSMSTMHRIQHGQTDPQLGTLRELAIACGLDIDLRVRPLADPFSAQAARVLLETGFVPDTNSDVSSWLTRFERAQLRSPIDILKFAGRSSGLLHLSAPSTFFRGTVNPLRLASAGDASGGLWALSGRPHLQLAVESDLEGLQILWVENAARAASNLRDSLSEARSAGTASVLVAQAPPALFQQSFVLENIHYVTAVQSLIDAFSIGGALEKAASLIAQEW